MATTVQLYNDIIHIKDIKAGMKNINVLFIVLEVGNATVTKENREVRTFKVSDHSACINVSVWDEPGKLLIPGDIVKLTKGYANYWRNCLTLYSGKNGEILKMGDFCMIFNEQLNMSEPNLVPINPPNPPLLGNGTANNGNTNRPPPNQPPIAIPPTNSAPPNSQPKPPINSNSRFPATNVTNEKPSNKPGPRSTGRNAKKT